MRAVLIGNYGVGNVGDEALKEYFLERFPEIEWTVLSATPKAGLPWKEGPRLPFGLRSFLCTNYPWSMYAIRRADAVVFGGGSLFTDVESVKAPLLWWWHAFIARVLYRRPIFLAFQGIGPFRTTIGEWCARWVVDRAAFVSVRDAESAARMKSTKIVQTFDPVVLLLGREKNDRRSENVLTIIPRHNSGETMLESAKKILEEGNFDRVSILLMQPSSDKRAAMMIRDGLGRPADIIDATTLDQLCHAFGSSSLVVTERYHGALAALAMNVPVRIVAQKAGDKLDGLRKLLGEGTGPAALFASAQEGEYALRRALAMLPVRAKTGR